MCISSGWKVDTQAKFIYAFFTRKFFWVEFESEKILGGGIDGFACDKKINKEINK